MTSDETILGAGRFSTDRDRYAATLKYAKQRPDRVCAVEGCRGIGRHIASRLMRYRTMVVLVGPHRRPGEHWPAA